MEQGDAAKYTKTCVLLKVSDYIIHDICAIGRGGIFWVGIL